MRIIYIGTGEIGIPTLSALLESHRHEVVALVTQPDRPAGRGLAVRPALVKTLALEKGVRVFQPEKLRNEQQLLSAFQPDVIVVMAYGQILPKSILQLPKVACLNLHASLLPRHRGASPIHAALLEGDRTTGITIMYMDEGLDTGDILLKESIDILPQETSGGLHNRLAHIAPRALMKALELLEQGKAPRVPQDCTLATYAPKLTKENARLDWYQSAEALDRQIRAMHPWPGAFCHWLKEGAPLRLRILEAFPQETENCGAPGEVLEVGERGISVRTSRGSLLLSRIQLEGRKPMSAAEFARGHSVHKGTFIL